ncbi:YfdX family protein [Asaia platycodi]|uniref:YfdX family protein n=1 Tax=Asaia platycodi TaxID=610243 RepID=UPI000470F5BC|nr:YfdX family protein [Asaia platycodi]
MRHLFTAGSALFILAAVPAFAASSPRTAEEDFARLSQDGQKAFADIVQAQQALVANQPSQAQSLITDAQQRLAKATQDNRAFLKAQDSMQAVPSHGAPKRGVIAGVQVHWLPVGGEYAVTEALAPEKQSALANANTHLQNGDTGKANQDLQIVGTDIQYVVGLAPLEMVMGDVNRASVFMAGGNAASAADALQSAVDSVLFVSDDVVVTAQPPGAPAGGTAAATDKKTPDNF